LIVDAIVWTSLIAIVCLIILDWFEIMSIMDLHTNYHPKRTKIIFIIILLSNFTLAAFDAAGFWPIFHIFTIGYGAVISIGLSITFFILSRKYASVFPFISSESWIIVMRWSVLVLGLIFFLDVSIQFFFVLYEDFSFDIYCQAIAELSMVVFNIICVMSMAKRISAERDLEEEGNNILAKSMKIPG